MKIFVLGHLGFIGSHLLPALSKANIDVVTDMRYFDDRYDVVINLAAVTNTVNTLDPKLIDSNFILADKVFKKADRLIFASSCSAKYPETSPYALSKAWGEHRCIERGNSLALRFFNIYGSGANRGIVKYLIDQPDGATIILRGPDLIRDYIFIDDIIHAIMYHIVYKPDTLIGLQRLLVNSVISQGGYVDVGTSIGTTTLNLVNLFSELSGKIFNIESIDARPDEPKSMVSNYGFICQTPLRIGLAKTIHDA